VNIEQRYLRKENSLMIEINRLKDLLESKIVNENKYFHEKIEL
jgi:hypothetical protein